jgi:hypothetical protein
MIILSFALAKKNERMRVVVIPVTRSSNWLR